MKEFTAAAGRSAANEDREIQFKLGEHEFTAKSPTVGQLTLFLSGSRNRGLRSIESLFQLFSDILSDEDWAKMEGELRDGLDVGVLNEIASWLLEEWSARPTKPSPASASTRSTTGRVSTAKRSGKASTS